MWKNYYSAKTIDDALKHLAESSGKARIAAGTTDLILEMERALHPDLETLIDITRIEGLDQINMDENNVIHLGPLVTHNHIVSSKIIRDYAFPLAKAAWQVGSPQIRNRGTVAGNLVTASPANDTITPLMALDASLVLRSSKAERVIPLKEFYLGVRKTVLQPDEMVVEITFPAMQNNQKGDFIKFALRRAQAISLVNVGVILTLEKNIVSQAKITLGAVAPVIIDAEKAEKFLVGKSLDQETIKQASELAMEDSRPISDIRGTATYRRKIVKIITRRALTAIFQNTFKDDYPETPVLLWGKHPFQIKTLDKTSFHNSTSVIETTINGKHYSFTSGQDKTLLHLLREEGYLTGTKEGCSEGECGACTIFLDGVAVMSCLVPSVRAHQANIVTIEGIAGESSLHPVQEAFIEKDAVQCGYCTPGFIMSAVKLLEEKSDPDLDDIRQAITGNLCRCTGYYKIIEAIKYASGLEKDQGR